MKNICLILTTLIEIDMQANKWKIVCFPMFSIVISLLFGGFSGQLECIWKFTWKLHQHTNDIICETFKECIADGFSNQPMKKNMTDSF